MAAETLVKITPKQKTIAYWHDVWSFRELLWLLVWRDISVKYKQTVLGVAWAFLRPAASVVVFTIVFSKIANLPSAGVPYPLLALAGILPWQYFSSGFQDAGNSIVDNGNLVSKVYFPRVVIPMASVLGGVVDFSVSLSLFLLLSLMYGTLPDWRIVFLPFFFLLLFLLVFGCGLWFSALNAEYRDFRYLVPFVIQIGAYLSPVGYSSAAVPAGWGLVYAMNPLVAIIEGFRWCLLSGASSLNYTSLAMSSAITVFLVISGIKFFRGQETRFADII